MSSIAVLKAGVQSLAAHDFGVGFVDAYSIWDKQNQQNLLLGKSIGLSAEGQAISRKSAAQNQSESIRDNSYGMISEASATLTATGAAQGVDAYGNVQAKPFFEQAENAGAVEKLANGLSSNNQNPLHASEDPAKIDPATAAQNKEKRLALIRNENGELTKPLTQEQRDTLSRTHNESEIQQLRTNAKKAREGASNEGERRSRKAGQTAQYITGYGTALSRYAQAGAMPAQADATLQQGIDGANADLAQGNGQMQQAARDAAANNRDHAKQLADAVLGAMGFISQAELKG